MLCCKGARQKYGYSLQLLLSLSRTDTELWGGLMAINNPAQQWQAGSLPCLGKTRNRTSSPQDSFQDSQRALGHKAWGLGRHNWQEWKR